MILFNSNGSVVPLAMSKGMMMMMMMMMLLMMMMMLLMMMMMMMMLMMFLMMMMMMMMMFLDRSTTAKTFNEVSAQHSSSSPTSEIFIIWSRYGDDDD